MKETSHSNNSKGKRKPLASTRIGCDGQELVEEGGDTGVISGGGAGVRNRGGPEGGTLLEGSYDEAASAASFQQALAEWRTGGRKSDREQRTAAVSSKSSKMLLDSVIWIMQVLMPSQDSGIMHVVHQ